jgi:ribosomal protein S17
MLRAIVCAVLMVGLLAGVSLAAETKTNAVVVKFEKDTLTVKVGDKEKTVKFDKKTHVHDQKDNEVKAEDFAKVLIKDAKIELVEEDGKLIEINLK